MENYSELSIIILGVCEPGMCGIQSLTDEMQQCPTLERDWFTLICCNTKTALEESEASCTFHYGSTLG